MSAFVPFSTERVELLSASGVLAEVLRFRGLTRDFSNEAYTARTQVAFPLDGLHYIESGRDEFLLDLNQVAVIPAGLTTRDRHPATGDLACLIVTLDEPAVDEICRGRPVAAGLQDAPCSLRPTSPQIQHAAAVVAALVEPTLGPCAEGAEEALLSMLRAVSAAEPWRSGVAGARSLRLVRQVKEVVAAHPGPLSLSQIARAVGASPTYLTDLFRRSEGMPIYRYQMRLRLARALLRLPRAEDITDLALELGFSSHSHFTSAFRALYGVTPSAHRDAVRRRVVRIAPIERPPARPDARAA